MEVVSQSTGEVRILADLIREANPKEKAEIWFDFKVTKQKIRLKDFGKNDYYRIGDVVISKHKWYSEYEMYLYTQLVHCMELIKEYNEVAIDFDYWRMLE